MFFAIFFMLITNDVVQHRLRIAVVVGNAADTTTILPTDDTPMDR